MRLILALFLLLCAAGGCRCPRCPCPAPPDLDVPVDLGPPPDLACGLSGAFCHFPGQICCPGHVCIGGACALAPVRGR